MCRRIRAVTKQFLQVLQVKPKTLQGALAGFRFACLFFTITKKIDMAGQLDAEKQEPP